MPSTVDVKTTAIDNPKAIADRLERDVLTRVDSTLQLVWTDRPDPDAQQ